MDVNALTAELAEKLGLKDAAQRDAAAGIPARNAVGPAGAETQAVVEAEKVGGKEVERLGVHCRETEGAIRKCGETLDSVRRRRQGMDDKPPAADDLEVLRIARDGAIAAYNQFKSDNGLRLDASGDDRLVQVIWALFVVIIEGAFNSYFFAPISEHGIAGGFFAAFAISFINVACAFVAGALGLRYANNHQNAGMKLLGLVCFCVFVLFGCAVVVSLSAWFRGHVDVLRQNNIDIAALESQAWGLAVDSLKDADLAGLVSKSPQSFMLLIIGALCAIFGVWKGYEYDDPYPGFGRMFRNKEEAMTAYNEAKAEHDEKAASWRREKSGALREMARNLEQDKDEMRTAFEGFRRESASAAELPAQTTQLAHGLLSAYRQINTEIRADSPPPHFGQFPNEGKFQILGEECRHWRGECEKMEPEVSRLAGECDDELREIRRELNQTPQS